MSTEELAPALPAPEPQPVICLTKDHWDWFVLGPNAWVRHPEWVYPSVGCPHFTQLKYRHMVRNPRTGDLAPSLTGQKDISKVPSQMNREGKVHGFTDYGHRPTTQGQREQWALNPAHNIMLIGQRIHAFDVDVDDPEMAAEVVALILETLGVETLPTRYRAGVGRVAMFFEVAETADPECRIKRETLKIPGNMGGVEYRGTRAATVLAGFHKDSGTHYLHRDFGPPPVFSFAAVKAVWDLLRARYDSDAKPLEQTTRTKDSRRFSGAESDSVVEYMNKIGIIRQFRPNGEVDVHCPREEQHSSDTITSTTYTAGNKRLGMFKCLHGHCTDLDVHQFLFEIGYEAQYADQQFVEFAVTETNEGKTAVQIEVEKALAFPASLQLRPLKRDGKGKPKNDFANLLNVIRASDVCEVRKDSFLDRVEVKLNGTEDWRLLDDNIVARLREIVSLRHDMMFSAQEMSSAVQAVAEEVQTDSAQQWLRNQVHDGVERIERFCMDILGAQPSKYAAALGWYTWVALVGRTLEPAVKVDMVPTWISAKQGTGKSTTVQKMVPSKDWFGLVDLESRDDDLSRLIKGKAVLELAELRGLRSRDAESIKAYLSRDTEEWVPKYREHRSYYKRRCLFIGTTNHRRFLHDATGNRRWLPIGVAETLTFLDWPTMEQNIGQYWAEARDFIQRFGSVAGAVEHCGNQVHQLAEPFREAATVVDEHWNVLLEFLAQQPDGAAVHVTAIRDRLFLRGSNDQFRVAAMMTRIGWPEIPNSMAWRKPPTVL